MNRLIALVVLVMSCRVCWPAGEPFDPGKEREWTFLNQAKFRGTFVKMEDNKVFLRMPDGLTREFWPGCAEGVSASFLQRAMARLPANPSRPALAPGPGPIIDLAAGNLLPGALTQWKNSGRLGGTFTVMNHPPHVEQVQGRKAVVFEHVPWLLPLDFETLVSDFYIPEAAISGEALTVVAWLCNTGPVVDRETFLCWGSADCGELDTPDFSYGCYDALQWYDEKLSIPLARFPKLSQWHQFAYVVKISDKDKNRCELNLYVDGELVTGKLVRKPAAQKLGNNLAFIGCAWEAWWGHAWATRPARPYTGAIAGFKVYDRVLTAADIRQLNSACGFSVPGVAGPFASPRSASATNPSPANGAREIQPRLIRLAWTPSPDATAQVLYFGTNRADVINGTAPSVKMKGYAEEAFMPIDLKLSRLECGRAYYWRVEQVTEPRLAVPSPELWSFTTSEFDLEFDGPVSEAWPKEIKQDGFYSRIMDAGGYPIISPPGNDDIHMRAARHALQKILGKRPDVVRALQSANAAAHLASQEHRGWGWSPYVCSCYGAGEAVLREGAIMMHEMGHQYQMQGAEVLEPDFRHRLGEAFNAARRERLWIGDYGGNNMWENIAVCASWWINDMTQDEGDVRPREVLRKNDPRIYNLLSAYWPGDTIIDLHPSTGLKTDPSGALLEWGNGGGIEFFRPNVGWRFYERSVGRFTPVTGKPVFRTVGGVSALSFSGSDALVWDKKTWDELDGNCAWAADMWVYRDGAATGEQALMEWGVPGSQSAKLLWGATEKAYELPGGVSGTWTHKPEAGRWHYLVWVYTGGGVADGPGRMQVYVDGKLDNSASFKLALPAQARVTVGRGFVGGLAHLRVYNSDLHPLQIESMWARESAAYQPEPLAVAGRLLVDLDARILAPVQDSETWPFYPPSLDKPWLRSWVNRGTVSGKLHNDARSPGVSQPRVSLIRGASAVSFVGKSHMVSSFDSPEPVEGSVELWLCPASRPDNGPVLRWGAWIVPAKRLHPGAWQHVVVTHEKGVATMYVNGVRTAAGATPSVGSGRPERLILGGEGNGLSWSSSFAGHVARVRVHDGVLKPGQILANFTQFDSLCRKGQLVGPTTSARSVSNGGPVVDLNAAILPTGPVKTWVNQGSARGTFSPASERECWRPLVVKVDGRNGVDFSGRKSLVSSFPAPAALLGSGSFTVSLWGYCGDPRGLPREQTMMSWGRRPKSHAEFCWGNSPKNGAFIGGADVEFGYSGPEIQTDPYRHNAPVLNGWRHMAYSYNGSSGKLRIYIDGKLNREESLSLSISPGELICLGGLRTGRLADAPFAGLLGEVAIADAVLNDADISRLAQRPGASLLPRSWVVRLDAGELSPGVLAAWPNRGSLRGEFAPEQETAGAPRAEQVLGRKAVTFDGQSGVLRSDIVTPPSLTGDQAVTVEMWLNNPKLAEIETLLGLAPAVALKSYLHDDNNRAANFNFGSGKESEREARPGLFSTGAPARNVGWQGLAPDALQWQHVAWVYSGGYNGSLKVYVDGKLVKEQKYFTLDTMSGYPMCLGSAWNTAQGAMNRFSGALSRLRIYDYARTDEEIRGSAVSERQGL